jgi:hypothetical protein
MTPAIFLDQKETKKIGDKSSVAYKALMAMIRELKNRTGLKVSVIGTDSTGKLFEIDIED